MDIYYSYACRDSYLVHAWLKRVQQSGESLDLHWYPFAIQIDDPIEYWNRPWETVSSELRGFIAAEAAKRQGDDFFVRFHHALETAVHEQVLELGDETTLISAALQAGLDLKRFQEDWHNIQLAAAVHNSHLRAVERNNVFGTPTLVFPNGLSFNLELTDIPSEAEALETFRAMEILTVAHSYIGQLKRTNQLAA